VLEWRDSTMRIIDRYIFREVLSHVLLSVLVFTFALFVPNLLQLMNLLVRHSGEFRDIAELFLCTFPSVLTFTIPAGLLVGVLIGLSRMSADSELIAMNTLGISLRRLLAPIGMIALGAVAVTSCMTLWLGPVSVRTLKTLEDRMATAQASFEVQARVFDERFPTMVLYVQDVSAAATKWRGVFLAETGTGDSSRLTLAEDAIVIADREQNKLELHLRNGSTHQLSLNDPEHYDLSNFSERDLSIENNSLTQTATHETSNTERSLGQLLAESGPDERPAHIEIHRRFAFPIACLVFALVAIPLGARARRGGRSAGFVIAALLVCGYYGIFVLGVGLARGGAIAPWLGIWAANLATGLGGILTVARIERLQGTGRMARAMAALIEWVRRHLPGKARQRREPNARPPGAAGAVIPLAAVRDIATAKARLRQVRAGGSFPQIIDLYLLRNFLFYFVLVIVSFLVLYNTVTLFNLLEDIAAHHTSLVDVLDYFRYSSYALFYQLAPLACLVAALITLAVMTKNNEIVAFKAAGVSLYRIAVPLLVMGVLFAAGLFLLDSTYLPYANQRQDELHNEIKGRPAQTYFQPQRQWIFGNNSKVYNYQLFDRDRNLFGGLNVFELDPATFEVRRRVYAARAYWEDRQKAWVLESGWVRDFQNRTVTHYASFSVQELPELDEPPSYFSREVRQSGQMDWWELREYIAGLTQAGFDVARLSVQLHEKLAFPLIAPVVILLAIPFSILVGTRGAVGGLALGVGVSFAYRGLAALCEAVGAIGQLPPILAAWSPDVIFLFVGLYFFLNMPT